MSAPHDQQTGYEEPTTSYETPAPPSSSGTPATINIKEDDDKNQSSIQNVKTTQIPDAFAIIRNWSQQVITVIGIAVALIIVIATSLSVPILVVSAFVAFSKSKQIANGRRSWIISLKIVEFHSKMLPWHVLPFFIHLFSPFPSKIRRSFKFFSHLV